jgi:hypothetical protein
MEKRRVFLSSVFRELIDGKWSSPPLRQRIIEERHKLPIELWAYEIFWPDSSEEFRPNADTVVDRCFAGIRGCDLFVFLLSKRHGSGVEYVEGRALASYVELELFAAAMLQKPVLVLHARGYEESEPPLRDALNLLSQTFTTDRYIIGDENDLYDRFQNECRRLAAGDQATYDPSLKGLPDWLSRRRSRNRFRDELANPDLHFLGGKLRSSRKVADPAKAKILVDQVSSGIRGDLAQPQVLPHGAALFRLWAAMRELMDQSESTLIDPSLAPLWDRTFGLWARSASWFGLHGHLWMGPLACVQSQILLRRKFAAEPKFHEAAEIREPLGARASALYSVAQRMHYWWQKVRHYRLAAALATQAIERDGDGGRGALLIRGYASMQMAQLGYVWQLWGAVDDFRKALELGEKSGASSASVGEAKVALGLSLVLSGRPRTGLGLLEEGVRLMRGDESASGLASLARALRSLERGGSWAGRRDIVETAREERLKIAASVEALDQMREP